MLTVTHGGLQGGTDYTVSVSAADAALNAMSTPFQWLFTTKGYLIFLPVTLRE